MALSFAALEAGLAQLPPPATDTGAVALVVVRPGVDRRETPDCVRLTVESGLEGDRWSLRSGPDPQNQITLMRADTARLIADGQPLELFGDNLIVELDVSESNLPAGTRIRIGTALCEVTPLPHTGCAKFRARFGGDALEFVNGPAYKSLRLRGIHVRVIEPGEVSTGDAATVVSRPA